MPVSAFQQNTGWRKMRGSVALFQLLMDTPQGLVFTAVVVPPAVLCADSSYDRLLSASSSFSATMTAESDYDRLLTVVSEWDDACS